MEEGERMPDMRGRQGGGSFWLWPACVIAWGIALSFFLITMRWTSAKEVNAETMGELLKCGGDAQWRYFTINHAHASEWKLGLARDHWLGVTACAVIWIGCSYLGRGIYRRIKSPASR